MRATLLVVVAHAAALAVLCVAGQTENPKVWHASEARECYVAKAELADLQSHVAELRAENIALRKVGEQLTNNLDALRTVSEELANNLDECRAENVKQPLVWRLAAGRDHRDDDMLNLNVPPAPPPSQIPAPRRSTLATPVPTPFTPIPSPFTPIPTTATPSATPSASPVPTTEGVTTHSQLAAAVADTDTSVVVVEADVMFPFFSAITVGSGRSVSVVGRSAVDGGRVVFDGAGHSQHFYVTGGTLHLAFIDLVNGTASQTDSDCVHDFWICRGGSVLVTEAGTLVMRSCDIRGTGLKNAYRAGGVAVYGDESSAEFYNCSFVDLCAAYGGALHAAESSGEELATRVKFVGSQFLRNSALQAGVVYIAWAWILVDLFDCLFANNHGIALVTNYNGDTSIVRTVFRENTGSGASWPGYGSAVVIRSIKTTWISDSVFERNIGHEQGSSGGALTMLSQCYLSNSTFLGNTALNVAGGAALDVQAGAQVTVTDCVALANVGVGIAGGFNVEGALIVNYEPARALMILHLTSSGPH